MEVIGKIKLITETETFGTNGFRKRDIVVTTEDQYPQHLKLEFHQDKTDLLNSYQVGEDVKININLRGREWINPEGEAKYFNSIVGWRIERLGQNSQATPPLAQQPAKDGEEPDDLPF